MHDWAASRNPLRSPPEHDRVRGGGGGSCPFWSSREALAPRGIGKSVPRREDIRLLTGRGRYAADFSLPGQVHACIVRSPHAHAAIVAIDAAAALAAPGVLAVLTGGDAAEDGLRPIPHSPVPTNPHEVPLTSRDGSEFFLAPHPVLALDAVRYVGEPVAIVVAETPSQAMDAAELVEVTYRPLPAVARSRQALASGAPVVWPQHGYQPLRRFRGRRQGGDRRGVRAGGPCRPARNRDQPGHRRADGIARRGGRVRRGGGAVHRLHQRRRRRDPAARRHRRGARRREGRGAGRLRRCRRKFRHPQQHLSGIRAGRVGGETGRPAGQMGLRPKRRVSRRFSRPRPDLRSRACPRPGRQLPGAARDQYQQSRRQRDLVRAAGEGDRGLLQRLSHPGVVSARRRGRDQHDAEFRLSQRRASGGRVRPRTADRHRLPPPWLRPARSAPAQPGAAGGDAVPQPAGPGLRQRRLPGLAAARRRAWRLGRVRGAPGRSDGARPVSRDRGRGFGRAEYRRAARARRNDHRSVGHGRACARHDVGGPGARDEFRAGRRRMARRRSRARQARHRRHRSGAGRRRLGLGALDAARLLGDGQGRRRDRRERPADRRRRARGRRGRYRIRPAGVSS